MSTKSAVVISLAIGLAAWGVFAATRETAPPGYVPNREQRRLARSIKPEEVAYVELIGRNLSNRAPDGSLTPWIIRDRKLIAEILAAFRQACRKQEVEEEHVGQFTNAPDLFTFHLRVPRRGLLVRFYPSFEHAADTFGPAVAEIYRKLGVTGSPLPGEPASASRP